MGLHVQGVYHFPEECFQRNYTSYMPSCGLLEMDLVFLVDEALTPAPKCNQYLCQMPMDSLDDEQFNHLEKLPGILKKIFS